MRLQMRHMTVKFMSTASVSHRRSQGSRDLTKRQHLTDQTIHFPVQGLIMKLPIWGQPPDQNCFDDSIYWEVRNPIPHKYYI